MVSYCVLNLVASFLGNVTINNIWGLGLSGEGWNRLVLAGKTCVSNSVGFSSLFWGMILFLISLVFSKM